MPSVAAATDAGWLTFLLKEFFIFPELRPKNFGESSERKKLNANARNY